MDTEENQENQPHTSPFEAIRRVDENEQEFWSARDMAKLLGYTEFGKFKRAIERAEKACESSAQAVTDHFAHVSDMIETGKGAHRQVEDIHLSRYACYLLVQNADPEKPIVAMSQTYFAIQTRRQELADQNVLEGLTEDQKRLVVREQLSLHNVQLAETATISL